MWRTPPALKWLIKKRSRLSGLLLRLKSERSELQARLEAIERTLPLVERDLMAIDLTLRQHEIQIEPTEIRPIRPQKRQRLVASNKLGPLILQILREHDDWLTARDLTEFVGNHVLDFESLDPRNTLERVRRRLNKLAKAGLVERQRDVADDEPTYNRRDGRWRLARDRRDASLLHVVSRPHASVKT